MVSLVILKIIVHKLISTKIIFLMISVYTIPNLRHCGSVVAHTYNPATYVSETVGYQAWYREPYNQSDNSKSFWIFLFEYFKGFLEWLYQITKQITKSFDEHYAKA